MAINRARNCVYPNWHGTNYTIFEWTDERTAELGHRCIAALHRQHRYTRIIHLLLQLKVQQIIFRLVNNAIKVFTIIRTVAAQRRSPRRVHAAPQPVHTGLDISPSKGCKYNLCRDSSAHWRVRMPQLLSNGPRCHHRAHTNNNFTLASAIRSHAKLFGRKHIYLYIQFEVGR